MSISLLSADTPGVPLHLRVHTWWFANASGYINPNPYGRIIRLPQYFVAFLFSSQ